MKNKASEAIQALTALIESGEYPNNSRLPTERDLAQQLGITRTVLRKALSVLEGQEKIWRHVGRGTFVGQRPNPETPESLSETTMMTNPAEIMEARQILEPRIAAMSALRLTPNDLEKLEHCLVKMGSAADFETFEHWDGLFHLIVAESTRNSLLIVVFKTVNDKRHENLWGSLKKAAMTAKRQQAYLRHHRDMFIALKNRDPGQAEKLMRLHLDTIQRNVFGGI